MNEQIKNLITRLDLVKINSKMEKEEKQYPKGIMIFPPREQAPDFVKGAVVITPNDLIDWCKTAEVLKHKSEYNGKTQFRFNLLEGNKGLYMVLDTFKPTAKVDSPVREVNGDGSDLPF
tara:strand:- start:1550 stop:1906 length:357 start_codon:yes stop_codon:yes gene_type:complete